MLRSRWHPLLKGGDAQNTHSRADSSCGANPAQKRLVFFMMRKNSSSLTWPSPSLSASSIISWISSSVRFSPSSLATRLRFLKVMKPAAQHTAADTARSKGGAQQARICTPRDTVNAHGAARPSAVTFAG